MVNLPTRGMPEVPSSMDDDDGLFLADRKDNTELIQVVEAIFSDQRINLKSQLTQTQVIAIARAMVFAERYDSNILRDFVASLLELQVSLNARGRDDLRDVFRSIVNRPAEANAEATSLRKKFLGF
jgi:hypothetical protein